MNVTDLITLLEDCPPEAEVRLAHQPSWPLAFTVRGIFDEAEDGPAPDDDGDGEPVVWIVEGGHPADTPYAPRDAFDAARSL